MKLVKIAITCQYMNDMLVDRWKSYHDVKKSSIVKGIAIMGMFKSDERDGEWKSYHENGHIRCISEYKLGECISESEVDDEGKPFDILGCTKIGTGNEYLDYINAQLANIGL